MPLGFYVRMGFMALITALVLCARSQDSLCQCQCVEHLSYSQLPDLKAEDSRFLRHVKPPRSGEASRKPRALCWVLTQTTGALAYGLTDAIESNRTSERHQNSII